MQKCKERQKNVLKILLKLFICAVVDAKKYPLQGQTKSVYREISLSIIVMHPFNWRFTMNSLNNDLNLFNNFYLSKHKSYFIKENILLYTFNQKINEKIWRWN